MGLEDRVVQQVMAVAGAVPDPNQELGKLAIFFEGHEGSLNFTELVDIVYALYATVTELVDVTVAGLTTTVADQADTITAQAATIADLTDRIVALETP